MSDCPHGSRAGIPCMLDLGHLLPHAGMNGQGTMNTWGRQAENTPAPRRLAEPGDLVVFDEGCEACQRLAAWRRSATVKVENPDRFVVSMDSYRRHPHLTALADDPALAAAGALS